MNVSSDSATERQLASLEQLDQQSNLAQAPNHSTPLPSSSAIKVGRRMAMVNGKDIEVFTMTLGDETIELLPLRNWGQLDLFKWRVRGKLPGTPAGLEITFDHIKLLGQTITPKDPDACSALERLFAEWLDMERETLEIARKKVQQKSMPGPQGATANPQEQTMHFRVEVDKEAQVHIHCVQGKETLATIGLNAPGFQSLVNQGFLRKPHTIKTGALHDWVELDGVLFSFEKGNNDAAILEKALNETYLPLSSFGKDKAIVAYSNAASSTGFDIQFPAKVGGVSDNRRRPLAEESLELLQDQEHCGLLQKNLVIKLSRPTLIFKVKTAEGGEQYLEKRDENIVRVSIDDGEEKLIDLSQPVSYLHLSAVDLTAVFNHPSINRHAKAGQPGTAATPVQRPSPAPSIQPKTPTINPTPTKEPLRIPPPPPPMATSPAAPATTLAPVQSPGKSGVDTGKPSQRKILPNAWLKPILEQRPIRFDWFICLLYEKIAAWARNSQPGSLRGSSCWFISMGEIDDLADPAFTGLFMTGQGALGFLSGGYEVLFGDGSIRISAPELNISASDVHLLAVGIDADQRIVFVVTEAYRSHFGLPESALGSTLDALLERGGILMSVKEALESAEPFEVVWTAPVVQASATDPQAVETHRPPISQ